MQNNWELFEDDKLVWAGNYNTESENIIFFEVITNKKSEYKIKHNGIIIAIIPVTEISSHIIFSGWCSIMPLVGLG